MKQKENGKGILNVRVDLAVLRGVKARAQVEGHTLQWQVGKALAEHLEPKPEPMEHESRRIEPDPPRRAVACPKCSGNGGWQDSDAGGWMDCDRCKGSGRI